MAILDTQTRDYTADSLNAALDASLEQAAFIRLTTRRGSYWANPTLGSHLYKLARDKDLPRAQKAAFDYAIEALAPLKDGRVVAIQVAVSQRHAGRLDLHITLVKPNQQTVLLPYFVPVGG